MILSIDIGGTKTLIATFSETEPTIVEQIKFPTPHDYGDFKIELANNVAKLSTRTFSHCVMAVPGVLDRTQGIVANLGNLDWENKSIAKDVQEITTCPVVIENDAKLAGLGEARNLKDKYKKILYVTVSTGIGIALINDGIIDDAIGDAGGHDMYVEYDGKRITWEELASGRTIYETYGTKASDIKDPEIWRTISEKIAVGLIDLIALLHPEIIVIGGGVGTHFDKFEAPLMEALKGYEIELTEMPRIIQAQNPEEAVVYGCFELANQQQ
ncbi:ROK family protein [Patescibacteria group bacterium]|nr:MAG: ROK family protein [Patescibacteria group bacterium]